MSNGRLPIYKQVAEKLKRLIETNRLPPGTYLPSERSLADEFRCSRVAIRQAVQELRKLGLVVSEHGRGNRVAERRGADFFIGVVTPYLPIVPAREIVYGIERHLATAACHVMAANSLDNEQMERDRIQSFLTLDVHGLIVVSCTSFVNLDYFEEVSRTVPIVIADRIPMDINLPVVRTDEIEGAYRATKSLIDQGHRRIACITQDNYLLGEERAAGYTQALAQHSIDAPPTYLQACRKETPHDVYRACVRILHSEEPPTALVVYDDAVAEIVYQAASDLGFDIPAELSVLSLSGTETAKHLAPSLSALHRQQVEVGAKAAQVLYEWIQSGNPPHRRLWVKSKLVHRKSVAPVSPSREEEVVDEDTSA